MTLPASPDRPGAGQAAPGVNVRPCMRFRSVNLSRSSHMSGYSGSVRLQEDVVASSTACRGHGLPHMTIAQSPLPASARINVRLHDPGPRRRAHLREGSTTSTPRDLAPDPRPAVAGATGLGPRRQRVHRVRHGPALRTLGHALSARGRGGRAGQLRPGQQLHAARVVELECGRDASSRSPRRRDGEVRQERLRRHDRGRQAGARRHRPRPGRDLRATSRSSPPTTGSSARRRCARASPSRASSRRSASATTTSTAAARCSPSTRARSRAVSSSRPRPAEPDPGFLEGLRALADEHGAAARLRRDDHRASAGPCAAHRRVYGVTPDLSTFGKALGNGFAVSALAGRRDVMELGGLRHDATGSSCSPPPTAPRPTRSPLRWR